MTFDKWSLKNFLTIDEIAKRLSAESKDNTTVSWPDVLSLALDGHLPLVVKIPPKTYVYGEAKNGSRLTIEGIWSLVMEGERGSNARRSIDRDYRRLADLPPANDDGIGEVWVEGDGEQWQLDPYGSLPTEVLESPVTLGALKSRNPSYPAGCIVGAQSEAVERLLAQEISPFKTLIKAEWKDVTITLLPNEQNVQITVHNKVLPVTSYEALGFENKRTKQSIKAWETFKELAESKSNRIALPRKKGLTNPKDLDSDGNLSKESWKDETGDMDRVNIENRVIEINTKLRKALASHWFEIPDTPAPLVFNNENHCYEPTPGFRILQK